MNTIRMAVGGAALLGFVAGSAWGDFYFGSIDFGGSWVGVNGSPLVAIGGHIIPQDSTDPEVHEIANEIYGGAGGWGTTVGGIMDEAPTAIPGDPTPGSFTVDSTYAIVPVTGLGAADENYFSGFYGGNEDNPDRWGVVLAENNDAWVARIRVTAGARLATSGPVVIAVQGLNDREHSDLLIDESGVLGSTGNGDNRRYPMNFRLVFREIPNLFTDGSDVYDVFVIGTTRGGPPPPPPPPIPDPPPAPVPTPDPEPEPEPGPYVVELDFNNDGVVDKDDIRRLILSYGPVDEYNARMDANRDRYVDNEDIAAWLDLYASTRALDRAEKKTAKNVKKVVNKVAKKTSQRDAKRLQAARLQDQLDEGSLPTKRWRKITKKISKLTLAVTRLQGKIEDLLNRAAGGV